MSAALDIDIAALVGEMEAIPCEHPEHTTRPTHTDEPASHYVQGKKCPNCNCVGVTIAACPGYVLLVTSPVRLQCLGCGHRAPASDLVAILGPVGSTK